MPLETHTHSDTIFHAIFPILRGGEFIAHHHADAVLHRSRQGNHSGHRMVEGQRRIHDIVRTTPDDSSTTPRGQNISK